MRRSISAFSGINESVSHHIYICVVPENKCSEATKVGERTNTFQPTQLGQETVLHFVPTRYSNFASGSDSARYCSIILFSASLRLVVPVFH